ncbi:hypothetical protein [Ensifer sp. 4252]
MTMTRGINAGIISRVLKQAGFAAMTEALLPTWGRAQRCSAEL